MHVWVFQILYGGMIKYLIDVLGKVARWKKMVGIIILKSIIALGWLDRDLWEKVLFCVRSLLCECDCEIEAVQQQLFYTVGLNKGDE